MWVNVQVFICLYKIRHSVYCFNCFPLTLYYTVDQQQKDFAAVRKRMRLQDSISG